MTVTPGGAVALTDLAAWCLECAQKARAQAAQYRSHAEVWEGHAARLERSAAQIHGALRIGHSTPTAPRVKLADPTPRNDSAHLITETNGVTFQDLPSASLEGERCNQDSSEAKDRTSETTRKRLFDVAARLWPTLSITEREQRLLEFAGIVLGSTVDDIGGLRRRDAWTVCRQLEARASDEGIGVDA
jgi:hypothetical protein